MIIFTSLFRLFFAILKENIIIIAWYNLRSLSEIDKHTILIKKYRIRWWILRTTTKKSELQNVNSAFQKSQLWDVNSEFRGGKFELRDVNLELWEFQDKRIAQCRLRITTTTVRIARFKLRKVRKSQYLFHFYLGPDTVTKLSLPVSLTF